MENEWGVNYVTHTERRCGCRTFNGFAVDVALAIPDYKLYSVQMSGTDANAEAILMANEGDMKRCLFGIGSYVGGDKQTQMYSTSGYSARQLLAMPQEYNEANCSAKSRQCLYLTTFQVTGLRMPAFATTRGIVWTISMKLSYLHFFW